MAALVSCGPGERIELTFPEEIQFPATLIIIGPDQDRAITFSDADAPCFVANTNIIENRIFLASEVSILRCAPDKLCCSGTLSDFCFSGDSIGSAHSYFELNLGKSWTYSTWSNVKQVCH